MIFVKEIRYTSFVDAGESNKADRNIASISAGSSFSAGSSNVASGLVSVIIVSNNNKASGDYSISMGVGADANKERSLVINLRKKDKEVSSYNNGEFLVYSDFFTIKIGKKGDHYRQKVYSCQTLTNSSTRSSTSCSNVIMYSRQSLRNNKNKSTSCIL